jgi:CBS domain-containing protein
MTKNVKHLSKDSTYSEVQKLLLEEPHFKAFPIVKNNGRSYIILRKHSSLGMLPDRPILQVKQRWAWSL